jgi:hypothetical protein
MIFQPTLMLLAMIPHDERPAAYYTFNVAGPPQRTGHNYT